MRVVTPEEMAALDRAAIEGGIPSLDLMERAGRAVAEQARDLLSICSGKKICVIAAKGNNGGDGFVAARYLESWGAEVRVFFIGDDTGMTMDTAENRRRYLEAGGELVQSTGSQPEMGLSECELVIDAIFGTGFRGEAKGEFGEVIDTINASGVPVLAVDVPSGADAAKGAVPGPAVMAARTVTFAWPKIGLYLYPGAERVGELVVADIGIPHDLLATVVESDVHTIEEAGVIERLPRRSTGVHKGECGRVLIVAGSPGLTGAAVLSARSAMRAGTGVVTLGVPASLNPIFEVKLTEVMTLPLSDEGDGHLAEGALEMVIDVLSGYDVLALGPGLGTAPSTRKVVAGILRKVEKPVILDADGINCIASDTACLAERDNPTVITPHPGELGRLLDRQAGEIQAARLDSILEATRRFGCVVVLKGANTMVASPDGRVLINPLALPGLATAGSGDVLTGCLAALCAQGLDPLDAAACGVFIHGKAAEIAAHLIGPIGMVAGDVVSHLPLALSGLLSKREGGWVR
jgi:hydroxyethylthiazole kinase-like uncharacterized protein yjeF